MSVRSVERTARHCRDRALPQVRDQPWARRCRYGATRQAVLASQDPVSAPPRRIYDCAQNGGCPGTFFQNYPGTIGNGREPLQSVWDELHRKPDQFRKRVHVELLSQLIADVDDRLVADVELGGDAAVGFALG